MWGCPFVGKGRGSLLLIYFIGSCFYFYRFHASKSQAATNAEECHHRRCQVSSGPGFCRPEFIDVNGGDSDGGDQQPQIRIVGGWHPVLDVQLPTGCVANDTELVGGRWGRSAMLVTGPNMGGKSCFIRQTALIVIMAQVNEGVLFDWNCSFARLL